MNNEDLSDLNLPELEANYVKDATALLFSWLRTFWTKLYKDKSFVRGMQGSRAVRLAQLYLDLLESTQLLDHTKAPVFHRERWYPIVVRKSRRNTGDITTLKLGSANGAVLSKDGQHDGPYRDGQKFVVGPDNAYDGFVTYALDDDVRTVVSCIVDSIANPTVILNNGVDFKVLDRSIVLRDKLDPFTPGSGFATFEVPEGPDTAADEEAVLWACDTLIDKDYVFKFSGYAIGLKTESTEQYARIVKNVWDATTDGLSVKHLVDVIAAMCCVPVVKEPKERVEAIYEFDGRTRVVTDKNVYTLGPNTGKDDIRDSVKAGSTLFQGELFDKSVRIYPFVRSTEDVSRFTEFDEAQFKKDVTSLEIPAALIRTDTQAGFYVGWDTVDIICNGFDKNGNPKLSFDIGLDDYEDVKYWSSVWSWYENAGKSMASCFDGLESGTISEGSKCGEVSPLEYFLKNLVGANTLIVVVDTDKIPDTSPLADPNFFQTLRRLIPKHVRLYFVEHGSSIDDEYFCGDSMDDSAEISTSAYDDYDDELDFEDDDYVDTRFVRKCRGSEKDDDDYD